MTIESAAAKPENSYEFTMFAEHYQFYVHDQSTDPGAVSIFWPEASQEQMLLVGDRLLGVATVRNLEVPVLLDLFKERPDSEDLEEFDHVVETSLSIPSGALVISGATEDFCEPKRLAVQPGLYGVRICSGGLDELDEEGFEGEDFYRIAIWPSDKALPDSIVKEWTGPRRIRF